RVAPKPISVKVGVSVGLVNTTSHVTIAGTITTRGNLTVTADSFTTSNTVAQVIEKESVGLTVAVSVIGADTQANVTNTAHLEATGDLNILASTLDRVRVLSQAVTGLGGTNAAAIATSFQDTNTRAYLDGYANVQGKININAVQTEGTLKNNIALAG